MDRYWKVRNFKPEPFWKICLLHRKEGIDVRFNWKRGHLFDRMTVVILFERAVDAGKARVTKVLKKPTRKYRPLPLTTVELQKNGTRFLRMDSKRVMTVRTIDVVQPYRSNFLRSPNLSTIKDGSATLVPRRTSSTKTRT